MSTSSTLDVKGVMSEIVPMYPDCTGNYKGHAAVNSMPAWERIAAPVYYVFFDNTVLMYVIGSVLLDDQADLWGKTDGIAMDPEGLYEGRGAYEGVLAFTLT